MDFLVNFFRHALGATNIWRYLSVISVTIAMGFMLSSSTEWWWVSSVTGWIMFFMAAAWICGFFSLCEYDENTHKVVQRFSMVVIMTCILAIIAAKSEKETFLEIKGPIAAIHQQEMLAKQQAAEITKREIATHCASYVSALNKLNDDEKVAVLRATGHVCNY